MISTDHPKISEQMTENTGNVKQIFSLYGLDFHLEGRAVLARLERKPFKQKQQKNMFWKLPKHVSKSIYIYVYIYISLGFDLFNDISKKYERDGLTLKNLPFFSRTSPLLRISITLPKQMDITISSRAGKRRKQF